MVVLVAFGSMYRMCRDVVKHCSMAVCKNLLKHACSAVCHQICFQQRAGKLSASTCAS